MRMLLAKLYVRFLIACKWEPPSACGMAGLRFGVSGADVWERNRNEWCAAWEHIQMWRSDPLLSAAVLEAAGEPITDTVVFEINDGEIREVMG